jgi:hypothetical protein
MKFKWEHGGDRFPRDVNLILDTPVVVSGIMEHATRSNLVGWVRRESDGTYTAMGRAEVNYNPNAKGHKTALQAMRMLRRAVILDIICGNLKKAEP